MFFPYRFTTFKLVIFSVSMSLGLSGCNKNNISAVDTVIVGVPSAPQTIDPRFALDAFGQNLRSLLFSSLVRLANTGPNNSLEPVPDLALKWRIENSTYIFELREGARFSDGSSITEEDIRFSISSFQQPSNPFAPTFKKIKNVSMNKNQLRLTTEKYESTFFLDLAVLPIMPKKIIEKYGDNYYQHLIGSGAFKLDSADESTIRLSKNTFSHNPPKIAHVIFKVIRDDNSRFLRLYKGDVDLVVNDMPSSKVSTFESSKNFKVYKMPGANITYLLLNLRNPILQNINTRKAIVQAIDKADIIKYKLEGLATPADTFVLPQSVYYEADLRLPMHSTTQAQNVISTIGEKTELEIKTSNQRSAIENGKMLAYQLEKSGFQVSLKSYEWGTYYADIKKGNFQIATMKAVGVQDPDLYRLMFHSLQTPPHGLNRGFYKNPELDILLEQGNQIINPGRRRAHYRKIQQIILKDLPMIPLWYDTYVAILNPRITHFEPSPQTGFNFLLTIEKSDPGALKKSSKDNSKNIPQKNRDIQQ